MRVRGPAVGLLYMNSIQHCPFNFSDVYIDTVPLTGTCCWPTWTLSRPSTSCPRWVSRWPSPSSGWRFRRANPPPCPASRGRGPRGSHCEHAVLALLQKKLKFLKGTDTWDWEGVLKNSMDILDFLCVSWRFLNNLIIVKYFVFKKQWLIMAATVLCSEEVLFWWI